MAKKIMADKGNCWNCGMAHLCGRVTADRPYVRNCCNWISVEQYENMESLRRKVDEDREIENDLKYTRWLKLMHYADISFRQGLITEMTYNDMEGLLMEFKPPLRD